MYFDVPRDLLYIVYISPILSLLVQGLLSLEELLWLSSPHCFNFDFKVFIFWQFFSYMNWSILFGGVGHINKQAAFFLFVLDNDVCFVGLYLTSCQYLHILTRLWCCQPRTQACSHYLSYQSRLGTERDCLGLMLVPFLVSRVVKSSVLCKNFELEKIYTRFHSRKQPDLVATILPP